MQFKKDVGAVVSHKGVSFRVWAPFADSVVLIGSFNYWTETPMQTEGDGYWSAFVDDARVGQEYKYLIKNGDKIMRRNDPRALHVTTAAGHSVISSDQFDWGDDNFVAPPLNQCIIYELHVGTFFRPDPAISGTFHDIITKLDHLAGLGINMIELMPISSTLGWGYVVDYLYAVEAMYGGRHQLQEFVKAAHQRGIGVIMDVVYNHLGPETLDLWQFDGWQENGGGGIYFYNDWRAETPWGNTRPDLGRKEVRQFILDNVKMWLKDCHIDGLRVDSTIYLRNVRGHNNDQSTDLAEGWSLLQQINTLAHKIKPGSLVIAEDIADNDYITKPAAIGGAGFNTQWELNFAHSLRPALHHPDIDIGDLCTQLSRRFNDDAFQRVIFMDSHDTSANGSARFNELASPGKGTGLLARKQSLIAAALLLSAPGIPMLFMGQEFLNPGSFSDWEALDWRLADKQSGIVEAYKHLISLRLNLHGNTAGLSGQHINLMHVNSDAKVLAYHRWDVGGPGDDVVAIINFSRKGYDAYHLGWPRDGLWQVRFFSTWPGYAKDFHGEQPSSVVVENGEASICLPANCAVILSQDN